MSAKREMFQVITATKIVHVYGDDGTGANRDLTVVQADLASIPDGYYMIGQAAMPGKTSYRPGAPPSCIFLIKPAQELDPPLVKPPVDYEPIWNDHGSGGREDGSFWRAIPPQNYVALGDIVVNGYDKPSPAFTRKYACIREDLGLLLPAVLGEPSLWDDRGSGARRDGSLWEVKGDGLAGFFKVWSSYDKPGIRVYVLPGSVNASASGK
ncbi:uncharacterized protein LOC110981208 [Acanthaster planci]|uniref:Uncharacterized protein LOC110981208 n=1 Tax=Acanthaster planci TaxID=133434 RepID=A0A8B7YNM4_ACAPL|nr:uncharacterized protein LOC110981208 [Acanthaster planci]